MQKKHIKSGRKWHEITWCAQLKSHADKAQASKELNQTVAPSRSSNRGWICLTAELRNSAPTWPSKSPSNHTRARRGTEWMISSIAWKTACLVLRSSVSCGAYARSNSSSISRPGCRLTSRTPPSLPCRPLGGSKRVWTKASARSCVLTKRSTPNMRLELVLPQLKQANRGEPE